MSHYTHSHIKKVLSSFLIKEKLVFHIFGKSSNNTSQETFLSS